MNCVGCDLGNDFFTQNAECLTLNARHCSPATFCIWRSALSIQRSAFGIQRFALSVNLKFPLLSFCLDNRVKAYEGRE
jgi:hypothetical protein